MSKDRDPSAYLGAAYPFSVIRRRLREHPRPYLDFAIGRLVDAPPSWLPDFLREKSALALRRAGEDERRAFADAASQVLRRVYGAEVGHETTLLAPSGRAAMAAFCAATIDPGDEVLITEPGYPAFARLAAQRHARLRVATLDPDRDFAPDLEGIEPARGRGGIRLAGLNYPNNPTGALLASKAAAALRERLGPEGVLFNDAVYGPLTHEGQPFSMLSPGYGALREGPVVELHSLGKLFALGPLGVAFFAGDRETIARVAQYSDFAWTQISSLQARTATRCLESWEHVETLRAALRERLEALAAVVRRLGFEPFPAPAGMYLLCRLPAKLGGKPVRSATEAADLLLREHDLAVAPFEAAPHAYLRFAAAYRPEEIEALAGLGSGFAVA